MNLISLPSRFHHISYIYTAYSPKYPVFLVTHWTCKFKALARLDSSLKGGRCRWILHLATQLRNSETLYKKKTCFCWLTIFALDDFGKKKKHVQSTQNHQPLGGVCFCFFKTPRSFTVFLIVAAESLSGLLKGSSLLSIKKRITPAENSVGSENCRP